MNHVRSLTQAYSQAPWRRQMQLIGLFLLVLVLVAVVVGIYLNVTARAATIGRQILYMQADIENLELINTDLNTKLGVLTSAAEMEKRALEMGFQPIERDQALYIVVPGYPGRKQPILAPEPTPVIAISASLPPAFTESLLDWLWQRAAMISRLAAGDRP